MYEYESDKFDSPITPKTVTVISPAEGLDKVENKDLDLEAGPPIRPPGL